MSPVKNSNEKQPIIIDSKINKYKLKSIFKNFENHKVSMIINTKININILN